MSRRVSVGLFVLVLLGGLLWAAPDFSGKWVLNKDKSDYRMGRGGGGSAPDITMTVEQAADALKVRQHMSGEFGDRDTDYTLTVNGQSQEIPGMMGQPAQATAKWDGDVLVIETRQEVQRDNFQGTVTNTDRWELSADGQVLTISGKSVSPRGERESKRVFEKK
jgi:hypothetical protein